MIKNRIKAIPLYLSGSEATSLVKELVRFFDEECKYPDKFVYILGQDPFCEETYLSISYEGVEVERVKL